MRTPLALALWFSLAGCTDKVPPYTGVTPGDTDDADTDDADTDSGEADDTAPPAISAEASDITVEVSPFVVTVARVSWTTDIPSTGYVEFGETADYGLTSNTTDAGTEHSVLLLGVPADTAAHFRVVTEPVDDGTGTPEEWSSDDLGYTTGSLPSGMPVLTVTGETDQWAYQAVPLQGTEYVIAIIDNQGRYVWYDVLEQTGNLMRFMMAADRQSVILCHAGSQDNLAEGRLVWTSLWGDETVEVALPYVDHDATELPDGTIAAIVVKAGEGGASADSVVEMDKEGNLTEIWNAWDQIDPTEYGVAVSGNWTHGNALDYVPEEDAYYLSMKEPGTVVKIDRSTGQTVWMVNGKFNQFTFPEGAEIVQMQHQLERVEGGLLVFDNGPQSRGYSRAVELALDEENLLAEEAWSYIRDPSVYVFAKGDVARFADGSTQVVWSSSGEIQNVDVDGEVVWQLNTDLGQATTFVQVLHDLYVRD